MSSDATQKAKTYTCPECHKAFRAPTAVGRHRLTAHGIPGQSKSAIALREQRTQKKETKGNVRPKKETTIVKARPPQPQPTTKPDHRLEATAAFAAGRVTELLQSVALQHNLPPGTLTAIVLSIVHAQALR